MDNFKRTFRTKPDLVPQWKNQTYEDLYNQKLKTRPIKDSKLPFEIYFKDDEKLMSFYLGVIMTGQFMGIKASEKAVYSNNYQVLGLKVDEQLLKCTFNSAYSTIKYFQLRYKSNPKLVQKFINGRPPLSGYGMSLQNIVRYVPTSDYLKNIAEHWEFFIKMTQELTSLERVDSKVQLNLFYQVMSYYLYETLIEPIHIDMSSGIIAGTTF